MCVHVCAHVQLHWVVDRLQRSLRQQPYDREAGDVATHRTRIADIWLQLNTTRVAAEHEPLNEDHPARRFISAVCDIRLLKFGDRVSTVV